MEILSSPFSASLRWYQRRSRPGYTHPNGATATRKKMKTVRLGGSPQRGRRIKGAAPKLRLKVLLLSPFRKLKNAYLSMMLSLGSNGSNVFGEKRIPKARHLPTAYSTAEFDNRLVLEIYKSLLASRELAAN